MAIYYVKNGGNNALSGLDDTNAWETVAYANATISAGDQVLFKRGSTWREQFNPVSGSAGTYTYYGAYGSGSKPKFLGSVSASDPSDWTDLTGNIWRSTSGDLLQDVGNLIFGAESTCGIKQMSLTPTLDHLGDFWYSFSDNWVTLYCTQNPATYWTTIECALNKNALTNLSGKQYITFQNLDWRYWGGCVWAYDGNYFNFYNCDMSYIGGADQYGDYTVRYGNGLQMWQGVRDINIECCKIDNCYDAGISPQGYSGAYTAQNLVMRNNIITRCEYGFEFYFRPDIATASNIYFEHNVIAYSGAGWGHTQRPDGVNGCAIRIASFTAAKSNIFIRNNIFFESSERLLLIGELSSLTNVVVDYNLYYNSVGYIGRLASTNYSSFANWAAAISQESHGIGWNPLFVSPISHDFRLQSTSLGIGSGLAVAGVLYDFVGANWFDPPSMGAYEYYDASPPVSPPITSPPYSPPPYSPSDPYTPTPVPTGTPCKLSICLKKIITSLCTDGIYLRWWFNGWHYFNFTNGYEIVQRSEHLGVQVMNFFSVISKSERPTKIESEYSYTVTLEGITAGNITGFTGLLLAEKVEQYEEIGDPSNYWREVEITAGDHPIKDEGANGYKIIFEITRKELPGGSSVYHKTLKLYIGDTLCDLDDDERIPINKQVNDIAEMQDRQSDFTAEFKIRKTRAMKDLFELSGEVGANTVFPYQEQECHLVQDGIEIITAGKLILIRVTEQYYYVSILSGNVNFFKQLETLKLADLDAAGEWVHTWDVATMVASHADVSPSLCYVYPLCEPSDDGSISPLTDDGDRVDMYGGWIWCFIRLKCIWDEIIANSGFSCTGGELLNSDTFLKAFIPISQRDINNTIEWLFSSWWSGSRLAVNNNILGEINFTGTQLIKGNAQFKMGSYYLPYAASYTVRVFVVCSNLPTLKLYLTGINQGNMTVVSTDYISTATYEMKVVGVPGDFVMILTDAVYYFYWSLSIVKIEGALIDFGSVVDPRNHLPDMTQIDFIKMVCNMFGLVPDVTARDRVIRFWNYEELYDNIPIARDWSAYLSERDDEVEFKYGDYAQKNYLKYKDSSDVTKDNGQGIMEIDDETLHEKKDVITLPVSYSDEVTILTNNFSVDVSRIAFNKWSESASAYQSEKKIDPRIVYIDHTRAIVAPPYEKEFRIRPAVAAGGEVSITSPKKASSIEISFSTLVTNYASLSRLLTKTNLRKAKFNLPVYEVAGLKHNIPIYLSQYKAYFYVNKINNYVAGQLCTIDLIKM